MDDTERGFYHHCLNVAWINDGLPADPAARARALQRNRNQADKRWTERIASRFVPHPNRGGYLVNTRQEQERVHARQVSASASVSAKARYERTARAYDSDSDSAFDLHKTSLQSDNFAMFLEVCAMAEMQGSETDLKAARVFWVRLGLADQLAACSGIKDRIAAGELADPGFRPLPQNYLKNKTWQRTVRQKQEPAIDKQHAKRNEVLQMTKLFGGMK